MLVSSVSVWSLKQYMIYLSITMLQKTYYLQYLHIYENICTLSAQSPPMGDCVSLWLVVCWSQLTIDQRPWCRRMAAGGWLAVAGTSAGTVTGASTGRWSQSGRGQHGGHSTWPPGPGPHLPRPRAPALAPPPWTPTTRPAHSRQRQVTNYASLNTQAFVTSFLIDLCSVKVLSSPLYLYYYCTNIPWKCKVSVSH